MGFFDKLKQGLGRTKEAISEQVNQVFKVFIKVDEEFFEELEEALIMADLGAETSAKIIEALRDRVKTKRITDGNDVKQELQSIISEMLSENDSSMDLSSKPAVILVIGVNGVGKTTSIGKLAAHYKSQGKKVMLAAADTFRAAAIDQLDIWAERSGCEIIKQKENSDPAAVVFDACNAAKARNCDILICDTAGRLQIDEELMEELANIKEVTTPDAVLLVVDAMTGQDSVNIAKGFNEAVGIDGVILSKLDGDTRGGAAISVKAVCGKPIMFSCIGEKLTDIEPFYPDRMASRILGMGDVLTLIDKAQEAFDEKQAIELEKKIRQQRFDLNDFLGQMEQMKNLGSLSSIAGMIPGLNQKALANANIDDKQMDRVAAIIKSMTPGERENPSIINSSRKQRIAAGCGMQVQDVNRLLRQFEDMQKMMKQFTGKGAKKKLARFGLK